METAVFVAGSGGHGIQNLGKTLVQAALLNGMEATCYPRYSIEKRGGYSSCYLLFSDSQIGNVKKERSDLVVTVDQRAFNMFAQTVKPGGYLLVNSSTVDSAGAPGNCHLLAFPIMDMALQLGGQKAISTLLTGIIAGIPGLFRDVQAVRALIAEKWSRRPELEKMNLAAFDEGLPLGTGIVVDGLKRG